MAALGYERFGPFAWTPTTTTETIEKTLGGVPLLWVETAHFKIGCSLESIGQPSDREEKKRLKADLDELGERLDRRIRAKKLDPWLRLHLAALRLERFYAEFLEAWGLSEDELPSPPDATPRLFEGPYLGLANKFQVLLLEKNSTLARYTATYCGGAFEDLYRYYDQPADSIFLGVAEEQLTGRYADSDGAMHWLMRFGMGVNFASSVRGYTAGERTWYTHGIARWFVRSLDERILMYTSPVGAATRADEEDAEFERKVRARVDHEFFPTMEEILGWKDYGQLKLADHAMLWSRFDYLMSQPVGVRRTFLLRSQEPVPWQAEGDREAKVDLQYREALEEALGMDLASFDAAWAEYVRKNYKKR